METEDRRTCISEMVDFPIGKRDFQVRAWSGAFWEPLKRKKRENQMYLQNLHSFAPLESKWKKPWKNHPVDTIEKTENVEVGENITNKRYENYITLNRSDPKKSAKNRQTFSYFY